LQIAIGSADELEYHLLLAADLHFISTAESQNLSGQLIEVRRMLISLVRKLKAARNL
jgi:four helix bundle protein